MLHSSITVTCRASREPSLATSSRIFQRDVAARPPACAGYGVARRRRSERVDFFSLLASRTSLSGIRQRTFGTNHS